MQWIKINWKIFNVSNFYNSHDLTYLLLVGDKSQIPTQDTGGYWGGESDINYAYISGNDSYPEFFVGRFSCQNSSHINTEVERSIEYERSPQLNGDWYTNCLLYTSPSPRDRTRSRMPSSA